MRVFSSKAKKKSIQISSNKINDLCVQQFTCAIKETSKNDDVDNHNSDCNCEQTQIGDTCSSEQNANWEIIPEGRRPLSKSDYQIYHNTPISVLDFSLKTQDRLMTAGIMTVEKLLEYPEAKLDQIKGLGRKNYYEIIVTVCLLKKGKLAINNELSQLEDQLNEKQIQQRIFSRRQSVERGLLYGIPEDLNERINLEKPRPKKSIAEKYVCDIRTSGAKALHHDQYILFNDVPIRALDLSREANDSLRSAGITTVRQLLECPGNKLPSVGGHKKARVDDIFITAKLIKNGKFVIERKSTNKPITEEIILTERTSGNDSNDFVHIIDESTNNEELQNKEIFRMNDLHSNEIGIEKLNLSTRSFNGLKRAGINTLDQLFQIYRQQKLRGIRSLGEKSYQEINNILDEISKEGLDFENVVSEEKSTETYAIPEEIENISIQNLKLSERLRNSLSKAGFYTVGKILRMGNDDIDGVYGIGKKSTDELLSFIKVVKEKGIDYFKSDEDSVAKNEPADEKHMRAIDIETVNKLEKDYHFKSVWLTEWYGVTRSRINQILHKNINRGNWLKREFTDDDRILILKMINEMKNSAESENGRKSFFLSNNRDDCAFIFVDDKEIKCFYFGELPKDLQEVIKKRRLDCLSFEELEMADCGQTEFILKKEYFIPENTYKFKQFATKRGMSIEEYCKFLTGKEYTTAQATVTDEKIIEFLNAHYSNEKLMIPSNNSTQWFRSFISRNGYTIDDIAELYGFGNNKEQGDDLQIFDTVEDDMQMHDASSEDWLDKLYAENPLIGNILLPETKQEEIFENAKKLVDMRVKNPAVLYDSRDKMQIALAVIIYAKKWDTEDEYGFWRFITSQFGYRDDTGQLRSILCDCVLEAMQKNRRWFFTSATGYQYKSTIVIHALATKRSWMHLYDFLFDFYMTNMKWTYIEGDPIVPRMVSALRCKLIADNESKDDDLEISDKVYSFQEGIQKLFIYRTGYAVRLITRMLKRIDNTIKHTEQPAELYVDVLCNQWIESRLKNAKETRDREVVHYTRDIAIDYTKIQPQYILKDGVTPVVMLPDIRLKKVDFSRIELKVLEGDTTIDSRKLSFYGNELGKTLSGFNVDIEKFLRSGNGALNFRLVILCDEEPIYDSGKSLYREYLCFSKDKECDIKETVIGSYSIFTPTGKEFEISGAEISNIDADSCWNAYYIRLKEDFVIKMDDKILSYDASKEDSLSEVTVISPPENKILSFLKNGHHYNVLSKNADFRIVAHEPLNLKKYIVMMNDTSIELSSIIPEISENNIVYTIPMDFDDNNICEFKFANIEDNRIIYRQYKLISGINVSFDKEFYFSAEDFANAFVDIIRLHGVTRRKFGINDEIISLTENDGALVIKIPRATVHDNTGELWKTSKALWIKDVSQDEKLYISYPEEISAFLKVGNVDIIEEKPGTFEFGNGVFAYSDYDISSWVKIVLSLKGKHFAKKYTIGRISRTERFLTEIVFNYRDGSLYWNRGTAFLGNKDSRFKLRILADNCQKEYNLDLNKDSVIESPDLPLGVYNYQIVKESENVFLGEEIVLNEGSLILGDENLLRFDRRMIQITNITFENEKNLQNVDISNTYIDQIKYIGIQYVGSENRECPVYQGIMFYMGQSGKHHEFSSEIKVTEKGFQLYKINPVRIVYINEHTLSITDEDGDGIYYYRYFDKQIMRNVYSITDRNPTSRNINKYSLADLYTYRKVEIH